MLCLQSPEEAPSGDRSMSSTLGKTPQRCLHACLPSSFPKSTQSIQTCKIHATTHKLNGCPEILTVRGASMGQNNIAFVSYFQERFGYKWPWRQQQRCVPQTLSSTTGHGIHPTRKRLPAPLGPWSRCPVAVNLTLAHPCLGCARFATSAGALPVLWNLQS